MKFLILALFFSVIANAKDEKKAPCRFENACLLNKGCQCYCSGVAKFRDKNASDRPLFIKKDPRGKGCYCKLWDLQKYPGPARRSLL